MKRAIIVCNQELTTVPDKDRPRITFELGRAYHRGGQHEAAITAYTKAAEFGYAAAAANLGLLYQKLGANDDAKRWLAVASKAGDPDSARWLAKP